MIVIEAGADGLVAAHHMARTGRRTLVLERAPRPDPSPDVGWIPPQVVRDLRLEQRGLTMQRADPWIAVPLPGGGRLELWRDMARSVEAIRRLSPRDADRWPEFCARMNRLARLLASIYTAPPPDLMSRDLADLLDFARLALRARGLGRQGIEDLLRTMPMSVGELLDDWFESDALKGAVGAAGILHLRQGPRAGGTAFVMLHHHVGSPPGVFRPPQSNLGQVLAAMPGIELRRDAGVASIEVANGCVSGVVLSTGERLSASVVVSQVDPRRTLLGLVDPCWLDPGFVRAVKNIRYRGVVARVTLSLDRPPGFAVLAVAPSLEYLERAHDAAKYGRVSERPFIEARSLGPLGNGRYRVMLHVQYAPYALASGAWDEDRRAALGDCAARVLCEHLPEIASAIAQRQVMSPADLEASFGWPEGQAHHGELALDQILFMRPVPECARYRTPIRGLYLCGPGTHPGGGIAGAAGRNAAQAVLRDLKRGRA
jgi:phytoene dehydrogenase-like protein